MATQRYISTSFWDDAFVQELDPSEKLFYMYLLTNPLTNIAGVYKITDRRISFDIGYTAVVIKELWRRFSESDKVVRTGEWVIIAAWPKHQVVNKRGKVYEGIIKILSTLPTAVYDEVSTSRYAFDLTVVDEVRSKMSIPSDRPSYLMDRPSRGTNYKDIDKDIDINNSTACAVEKQAVAVQPAEKPNNMKDELANLVEDFFWKLNGPPVSFGKERKACGAIARTCRERFPEYHTDFAMAIMKEYNSAVDEGGRFWGEQPKSPSGLMTHFDRVVSRLRERDKKPKTISERMASVEGLLL